MDKRIHLYLDGALRPEELSRREVEELAEYEALIRETIDTDRSIGVPDLTIRVMAQLPGAGTPGTSIDKLRALTRWLWSPRPIRLRPVYGIVMSLTLALMLIQPETASRTFEQADASIPSRVFVQFRLDVPHASKVSLAGSFTEWQPSYPLEQVAPGVWSVLIPLDLGVHNYAFIVDDGEWITDPDAPLVMDGFGGVNNRLSLLLPNEASQL